MESAIFRLKSSLEGVNQNNPLIFLPRIKSLRMFVIFPRKCLPLQSAFSIRLKSSILPDGKTPYGAWEVRIEMQNSQSLKIIGTKDLYTSPQTHGETRAATRPSSPACFAAPFPNQVCLGHRIGKAGGSCLAENQRRQGWDQIILLCF